MLLSDELIETIKKEMQQQAEILKSGKMTDEESIYSFEVEAEHTKKLQVKIHADEHEYFVDEPDPYGENIGPSPIYYFLGSYAACFEMNLLTFCVMSNVDLQKVHVKITATMDARDSFRGPKFPPVRLRSLTVHTFVTSNEEKSKLERILEKAKHECVIGGSLHEDIDKKYVLEVTPHS